MPSKEHCPEWDFLLSLFIQFFNAMRKSTFLDDVKAILRSIDRYNVHSFKDGIERIQRDWNDQNREFYSSTFLNSFDHLIEEINRYLNSVIQNNTVEDVTESLTHPGKLRDFIVRFNGLIEEEKRSHL
ncbi:MAG: hypothetical protein F4025_07965 [Synechococcus sp. SB0669_bin_7]|nr:hypothetical protein [Cyanobacteria bacterium MAG IRC3_bin_20]MYG64356.1 hypothetical protein [Synechococcus sp. SB0675_bin_7]MYK86318.1 hypothetical protein [Synechococcus sp. SB0669_bin_7]